MGDAALIRNVSTVYRHVAELLDVDFRHPYIWKILSSSLDGIVRESPEMTTMGDGTFDAKKFVPEGELIRI